MAMATPIPPAVTSAAGNGLLSSGVGLLVGIGVNVTMEQVRQKEGRREEKMI